MLKKILPFVLVAIALSVALSVLIATQRMGCPHPAQKRAASESSAPQCAQVRAIGAAQFSQNFALARFSCWQRWQSMASAREKGGTQAA